MFQPSIVIIIGYVTASTFSPVQINSRKIDMWPQCDRSEMVAITVNQGDYALWYFISEVFLKGNIRLVLAKSSWVVYENDTEGIIAVCDNHDH